MAPKKREPKNSDLTGTNIKVSVKGGKEYFYYIMPDGSHEALLHGDKKGSIEAAIALNQALRPSGGIVNKVLKRSVDGELLPKVSQKNPLFIEVLRQFKEEWLPERNYAPNSLSRRLQILKQYTELWPHSTIGDFDTFTIAQFLRTLTPESAKLHRGFLTFIFNFAASRGYQTQSPMLNLERRKLPKRVRARHTWQGHMAIYMASPPWLKRAILIALYSLQRRSDLVAINIKEHVNIQEKTVRILQQKTRNYDKPVYIDIGMGDELFNVVMEAIRSDIPCPYLLHYRPLVRRRKALEAKPHPFSVTADYLSKEYAKVRDKVGIYNDLPAKKRPGIHSLRALGTWIYFKMGHPEEYIMALLGHADKKMTRHYEQGHERREPVRVAAGLSLTNVDFSSINWETELTRPLLKIINSSEE